MTRGMAVRGLAFITVVAATLQCADGMAPHVTPPPAPPPPPPPDNSIGVIVSSVLPPMWGGGSAAARAPAVSSALPSIVFVSLAPASVPSGVTAMISNHSSGVADTIPVVDGGFDPVAVGANAGDTLAVAITTASAGTVHAALVVAARRAPRIVRTNPPDGGRDVPLNATIVVVFSEPIDSAALSDGSIRLLRDTTLIAGTLRFGDASKLRVEHHPASLLASETAYRLQISTAIRSVNGAALDSPLDVLFTTGAIGPTTDLVFASVSAGSYYTCGVATGGAAYCWGSNFAGQLGNGTTTSSATPVPVAGGLTFASVSTNDWYTCGVTSTGAAYCWGRTDLLGADPAALGACPTATSSGGSFLFCLTPVPVAGGLTFASVTAGYDHACGVATGGAAYCWGQGGIGELGTTGPFDPSAPVAVSGGLSFATVSAGDYFTCGVTTTGVAYCWGANFDGDLGVDTATGPEHCGTTGQGGEPIVVPCSRTPVAVGGNHTFVTVSAGVEDACGVTPAGAAYCWGHNPVGELGNGTAVSSATPVPVAGGLTFTSVSSSKGNHTCGVTPTQATYCWGGDDSGQLGDGTTTTSRLTPVPVVGGLSFAAVSAGAFHSCGVITGGTAYCWGSNSSGELGIGTTTPSAVPVKVAGQP